MSETADNTINILKSYTAENWSNWISDIVSSGIAYPVSTLQSEGEILVEIVKLLRANNISVFPYEKALCDAFSKEYYQNMYNFPLQERYLSALMYLPANSCQKLLINILDSRVNITNKGHDNYIKTLALQCLSVSPIMTDGEQVEILSYITSRGFKEMKHDLYFYSEALRFSLKKGGLNSFFETLTEMLIVTEEMPENTHKILLPLIGDTIERAFYFKSGLFNLSVRKWLFDSVTDDRLRFNTNTLSTDVLEAIGNMYSNVLLKDDKANKLDKVTLEETFTEIVISLLIKKDISANNLLEDISRLSTVVLNCLGDEKNMRLFKQTCEINLEFVYTTKIPVMQVFIENTNNSERAIKIVEELDAIIHKPGMNIPKDTSGIFKKLNSNVG